MRYSHQSTKCREEPYTWYSLTNHVSFLPQFGVVEAQGSIVTLSLTGTYIFNMAWEVHTSRLQNFQSTQARCFMIPTFNPVLTKKQIDRLKKRKTPKATLYEVTLEDCNLEVAISISYNPKLAYHLTQNRMLHL